MTEPTMFFSECCDMLITIFRLFSLNCFQFTNLSIISALVEGVENNDIAAVDRILQYDAVGRKNLNVNVIHYFIKQHETEITKYVKCWLNLVLMLTC